MTTTPTPTTATGTPLELLTPVERLALEMHDIEFNGRANNHLKAVNERLSGEIASLQAMIRSQEVVTLERDTLKQAHVDTLVKLEEVTRKRDAYKDQIAEIHADFSTHQMLADLRKQLHDAATSLCTISQQAGRTEELRDLSQIRGYAFSRYSDAMRTDKEGEK